MRRKHPVSVCCYSQQFPTAISHLHTFTQLFEYSPEINEARYISLYFIYYSWKKLILTISISNKTCKAELNLKIPVTLNQNMNVLEYIFGQFQLSLIQLSSMTAHKGAFGLNIKLGLAKEEVK